jgi:hypothetical protein
MNRRLGGEVSLNTLVHADEVCKVQDWLVDPASSPEAVYEPFHAEVLCSCSAKQRNRLAAKGDKPIPEPDEPRQRKQLGFYDHE